MWRQGLTEAIRSRTCRVSSREGRFGERHTGTPRADGGGDGRCVSKPKKAKVASKPSSAWGAAGTASPSPRRNQPRQDTDLGLLPPELGDSTHLLSKPPSVWCSVTPSWRTHPSQARFSPGSVFLGHVTAAWSAVVTPPQPWDGSSQRERQEGTGSMGLGFLPSRWNTPAPGPTRPQPTSRPQQNDRWPPGPHTRHPMHKSEIC